MLEKKLRDLHPGPQAEVLLGLPTCKGLPPPTKMLMLPNQLTGRGLRMQIYEPMGGILIQTTSIN